MKALFKDKVRRFHAMLAKGKLMDHKVDILAGEGVDSTLELTERQLDGLILWLDDEINGRNTQKAAEFKNCRAWDNKATDDDRSFALFDRDNRQHRYLLSLCQQMNWIIWDAHRERYLADLQRLGHWIRTRTESKKPLLEQNKQELERTIYQFEQMLSKQYQVTSKK
jgi:hypothetical protein